MLLTSPKLVRVALMVEHPALVRPPSGAIEDHA